MNILALDLGTRTGWALSEGGRIESGVQVFDVKRGESPGMRFIRFRRWLDEVAFKTQMIVYELPHHRGGAPTQVSVGFQSYVLGFAAERGLEHTGIHTATLKKFTTGKGNAKKPDMDKALIDRGWWNHVLTRAPHDDNEVDAVCLLHYALEELVPQASRQRAEAAPQARP